MKVPDDCELQARRIATGEIIRLDGYIRGCPHLGIEATHYGYGRNDRAYSFYADGGLERVGGTEGDTMGLRTADFELLIARHVQDDRCKALLTASATAEPGEPRERIRADALAEGYHQYRFAQRGRIVGEFYRLEIIGPAGP